MLAPGSVSIVAPNATTVWFPTPFIVVRNGENRLGGTVGRVRRGKVRPKRCLVGSRSEEHRVGDVDVLAHLVVRAVRWGVLRWVVRGSAGPNPIVTALALEKRPRAASAEKREVLVIMIRWK